MLVLFVVLDLALMESISLLDLTEKLKYTLLKLEHLLRMYIYIEY